MSQLAKGLQTAFIDSEIQSDISYRPGFIYNDYRKGLKVLSSIEDEMRSCDSFCLSVAFITRGGIEPLLQSLKYLEEKGIPGRVLTTDYLSFTEPYALKKLASLKNITLKMYSVKDAGRDFHTKGYIFSQNEMYHIILGSSNMTHNALMVNNEWNSKIVSTKEGEFATSVVNEFETLWNSKHSLKYEDFIDEYETRYNIIEIQRRLAKEQPVVSLENYRLEPNSMQSMLVNNIANLRAKGESKALLISATGTGKTYASAFALRDIDPPKSLFLVHREQIARQAIDSFRKVFQNTKTLGLLSGNSKEYDADILFATMQTMSKQEVREKFSSDYFHTIVIDEAHRTGAPSYKKIIDYFKPSFWLGMTASPDRMDGFDVYELFDHNIPCEIRLQQALEDDLLCPFHYFGITDIEVDGEPITEESGVKDFNRLVSEERISHIIEQINYYGYSGERAKGLIFCSSLKESEKLSKAFNNRGFRTLPLSGANSQEEREEAVERLAADEGENVLDYIFTVDVFNEGVDIPDINQIIMLRPTESPIIFVQQLGRGLRKAEDKEFVVILDFIGNYSNNFMIPIALSGDRTYNKDNIRRYITEGERIIPGASTVHFDEISRKRIFAALDSANFSDLKLIKENYTNLKNKIGRIPHLVDFDTYGEMDVLRIFDNKNLGSYYNFLKKYEKEYNKRLNAEEEQVIKFVSQKLASGKRIHELVFLKQLLDTHQYSVDSLTSTLINEYGVVLDDITLNNLINVMTNAFPAKTARKTFSSCVFIEKNTGSSTMMVDEYKVAEAFEDMLNNPDFSEVLTELVDFGIMRYKRDYSNKYKNTDFVLYQKYTYEDVCRLLKWKKNEVPLNIGGYKYDKLTNTLPVFINYHKDDDIQDTIKYEDHFTSPQSLVAISKVGRTMDSDDVKKFLQAEKLGITVELFVRKNKDDKISKEFYYLGHMTPTGFAKEFIMGNTNKYAVEIGWKLDTPVREDLYKYITSA